MITLRRIDRALWFAYQQEEGERISAFGLYQGHSALGRTREQAIDEIALVLAEPIHL